MQHSQFGVVNWFVRLALEGQPIPIFGSGKILRDFLYVDDCVEALLARGARSRGAVGEVLNVGHDRPSTFLEVAEMLREIVPGTRSSSPTSRPSARPRSPATSSPTSPRSARLLGWEPKVACGRASRGRSSSTGSAGRTTSERRAVFF